PQLIGIAHYVDRGDPAPLDVECRRLQFAISLQCHEARQPIDEACADECRPEHDRFAIDGEALGLDLLRNGDNRGQLRGPVISLAGVEPYCSTVPAHDPHGSPDRSAWARQQRKQFLYRMCREADRQRALGPELFRRKLRVPAGAAPWGIWGEVQMGAM